MKQLALYVTAIGTSPCDNLTSNKQQKYHTSLHNRIKQMPLPPPRVSVGAASPWAVTSLSKSTTDGPAYGLTLQTQWLRPRISDSPPTLLFPDCPRDSWLCVGGILKSLQFIHCLYPASFGEKNTLTSLDGTCHVKQRAYHTHRSKWAYKITKGLITRCSQGAVGYQLYGQVGVKWQFPPLYCTSAGVDVLRSCSLTNQVILIKPRAFLCHHHWLGSFLSPSVNHLGNRIRIYESKTERCTTNFCTCQTKHSWEAGIFVFRSLNCNEKGRLRPNTSWLLLVPTWLM